MQGALATSRTQPPTCNLVKKTSSVTSTQLGEQHNPCKEHSQPTTCNLTHLAPRSSWWIRGPWQAGVVTNSTLARNEHLLVVIRLARRAMQGTHKDIQVLLKPIAQHQMVGHGETVGFHGMVLQGRKAKTVGIHANPPKLRAALCRLSKGGYLSKVEGLKIGVVKVGHALLSCHGGGSSAAVAAAHTLVCTLEQKHQAKEACCAALGHME
eukprot:1155418-Pelagomonas_calceolata.AAC.7